VAVREKRHAFFLSTGQESGHFSADYLKQATPLMMRYLPKAALAGLLMTIASRLIDEKRLRSALCASCY
jgi:hypothetical protein